MTPGSLADFLLGRRSTRRSLLEELFNHRGETIHLRELSRRTGYSVPMVAKELGNLVQAGVVAERRQGQQRLFSADLESPLAADILRLTLKPERASRPRGAAIAASASLSRRPRTLREAATWGHANGNRDAMLREFLDEFYRAGKRGRTGMLAPEPPLLPGEDRANAYYAAVAEHLALMDGLAPPPWVHARERFLRAPFFPAGLDSLKAMLLVESPPAFRRRMIFVERDPLYRPRKGRKVH